MQRHALRSLRASRTNQQLRCLMQSIPSPANAPLFMEIPMDFTLQSAFGGELCLCDDLLKSVGHIEDGYDC